jgi:nucleotidyltransferase substrate binding protein (TIGR01987 family)
MSDLDIRWKQRLASYQKALVQLTKFIDKGQLNELETQGLIKAFEYTYELAWNLLRDYLREQGNQDINGSKDAIRLAFKLELIEAGEAWMAMVQDRNRTSHIYNEIVADIIAKNIRTLYFPNFIALSAKMQELARVY